MIVHSNEQQIPVEKYGARCVVPRDEMSEVMLDSMAAAMAKASTRHADTD